MKHLRHLVYFRLASLHWWLFLLIFGSLLMLLFAFVEPWFGPSSPGGEWDFFFVYYYLMGGAGMICFLRNETSSSDRLSSTPIAYSEFILTRLFTRRATYFTLLFLASAYYFLPILISLGFAISQPDARFYLSDKSQIVLSPQYSATFPGTHIEQETPSSSRHLVVPGGNLITRITQLWLLALLFLAIQILLLFSLPGWFYSIFICFPWMMMSLWKGLFRHFSLNAHLDSFFLTFAAHWPLFFLALLLFAAAVQFLIARHIDSLEVSD